MTLAAGRSKYEYAYDVLRSRIESGEYAPGRRLKIRDVARSLNTSEIPVREAIHRLSAESYIAYSPRIGVLVAQMSLDEIRQLLLTLSVLEGAVTRLAAPHVSPAMIEQLWAFVATQRAALADGDAERFGALNRQFHTLLWSACPVPALTKTAQEVQERIDRQKPFSLFKYTPKKRMRDARVEHEKLLRLLDERPLALDRIEALARWHKFQFLVALGPGDLARDLQRVTLLADALSGKDAGDHGKEECDASSR